MLYNDSMDKVTETKLHFAKVFTKLREEKPVDQIRIKDLCGQGGASRQTFYYHFIDKDDFISWMLEFELDRAYKSVVGPFNEEGLGIVLDKINSSDSFYRSMYAGDGASKDVTFLSNVINDYESRVVRSSYHLAELSKEQEFIIKYHSYALAGMIINSFSSSNEKEKQYVAKEVLNLMPPLVKDAFVKKLER